MVGPTSGEAAFSHPLFSRRSTDCFQIAMVLDTALLELRKSNSLKCGSTSSLLFGLTVIGVLAFKYSKTHVEDDST